MIYLASPYTHADKEVMQDRFERVCKVASRLMRSGLIVFSPISHTHPIAVAGELPRDWEYWKRFDDEFIRAAEKVVVVKMDGYEISRGVQAEIRIAENLGKLVEFIEE
jgi:uncharacterized protein DUF1937